MKTIVVIFPASCDKKVYRSDFYNKSLLISAESIDVLISEMKQLDKLYSSDFGTPKDDVFKTSIMYHRLYGEFIKKYGDWYVPRTHGYKIFEVNPKSVL